MIFKNERGYVHLIFMFKLYSNRDIYIHMKTNIDIECIGYSDICIYP